MTKLKKLLLVLCFAGASAVVVFLSYFLASYLAQDNKAQNAAVNCPKIGINHKVLIQNNQVLPYHTVGKLCDSLTIINKDNAIRLIAFGPHENHQPYAGVTEKILDINQSLSITLNQTGSYRFHDHLHDDTKGTFTVN